MTDGRGTRGDAAYRDFAVPEVVADQARAWLALEEDERPVVQPRRSATVMLLREVPALQVFVLRRAGSMAFAAGMLAFPGGGVDERDADQDVPWAGPSPGQWADRLGTDVDGARELVTAAAREVFEECGVLLAGPDPDRVVSDLRDERWRRERERLLDRSQSFAEMLGRHRLVLRTDLLAVRGHWITPECEPRRYDTRFFAARMPQGQEADDASTEADVADWRSPGEVLEGRRAGRDVLLPPTQVMVEELDTITDLDGWLREPVQVRPVLPVPVDDGGTLTMRIPR
ncbi:NUDIX hydrolase [Serinicoccus kebangsaanensis]|uniref:NUDIX hydrolase n=1 Tax=Serinicoccus kebangsaanensis TaxID=2602069 RepID=UPI00178C331A|nr:NUDIX domain-containing protein [Serinicoccus kebangsaanensis]